MMPGLGGEAVVVVVERRPVRTATIGSLGGVVAFPQSVSCGPVRS